MSEFTEQEGDKVNIFINQEPDMYPDDWQEYERRKKALPDDLTPAQYVTEIETICDELGL